MEVDGKGRLRRREVLDETDRILEYTYTDKLSSLEKKEVFP